MQEGDHVILNRDFGPCKAGSEGIVSHIDTQGNLTVDITHDPDCNPITFALPPASARTFRLGTNCS